MKTSPKPISQREARRLKACVAILEYRLRDFAHMYPDTHVTLSRIVASDKPYEAVRTARALGFAVVVVAHDDNVLAFRAVKVTE